MIILYKETHFRVPQYQTQIFLKRKRWRPLVLTANYFTVNFVRPVNFLKKKTLKNKFQQATVRYLIYMEENWYFLTKRLAQLEKSANYLWHAGKLMAWACAGDSRGRFSLALRCALSKFRFSMNRSWLASKHIIFRFPVKQICSTHVRALTQTVRFKALALVSSSFLN